VSLFSRFDADARAVYSLAGNLAARRERARTGEKYPRTVRITVTDLREAYRLLIGESGWSGSHNAAVQRRLDTLPDGGQITAEDLRKAMR
jgi:hypothetical protein